VPAEHFTFVEDRIEALPGSKIASYTLAEIENINREITKKRRRIVLDKIRNRIDRRSRLLAVLVQEVCQQPFLKKFLGHLLETNDEELENLYRTTFSPSPCGCGLSFSTGPQETVATRL
jgi:hypothetical protein